MALFSGDISKDDILNFLSRSKKRDYLSRMRDLVSEFKGKTFALNNPVDARLMICDLHDTIYSEKDDVVKGWELFYLPVQVSMLVIGLVKETSCPWDQLILMTCEDKKLYAYDEDELHVVALSLEKLCEQGMEYPASLSYYKGEAFKDMKDEDWDKLRRGAVGKSLEKAHSELVTKNKWRFPLHGSEKEEDRRRKMEKFSSVHPKSTQYEPQSLMSRKKKLFFGKTSY